MAKVIEVDQKQLNNIGAGTNIVGDIDCNGDIRIDGNIKGNLKITGKLVVGSSGCIKGEVICNNAQIEGKVEGKINVSDLISLKATSSVLGDMATKKLAIEPGAVFTGTCDMGSATNSVSDDSKKK